MKPADTAQDSKDILRLFVYGTLKRGYLNHEQYCSGAISIEPATASGRLYELVSGIPVLDVPEWDILATGTDDLERDLLVQHTVAIPDEPIDCDSSWLGIAGELMTFADPVPRLQAVDALEGFSPGFRSLYRRVLIPASRQDGSILPAWCYVLGETGIPLRPLKVCQWRGSR